MVNITKQEATILHCRNGNMIAKLPMREISYQKLREWLISEKIPLNSFLPAERELAEKFSTSRVTIRQALERLAKDGIIKKEKNRRPVVVSITAVEKEEPLSSAPCQTSLIGFYTPVPFSEMLDRKSNNLTNIVASVISKMQEFGRHVAYVNTYSKNMGDCQTWQSLVPEGVAGIIINPPNGMVNPDLARMINRYKRPVVLIEAYIDGCDINASCVDLDGCGGIYSAVKFAASLGHKNFAYLDLSYNTPWLKERLAGFERGVFETETNAAAVWTAIGGDIDQTLREKIVCEIKDKSITAVIAATDSIAIQLKRALEKAGIKIPDDLSVIGFDDTSDAVDARLTTLSHMSRELGEKAAEIMNKLLSSPQSNLIFREKIMPQLIVRNSVKHITAEENFVSKTVPSI